MDGVGVLYTLSGLCWAVVGGVVHCVGGVGVLYT